MRTLASIQVLKEDTMQEARLTRRDFLRLAVLGAAGGILAACGGAAAPSAGEATAPPAAEATAAPAAEATAPPAAEATAAPAAEATPAPEVPRGNPKEVAREKSLVIMWPPSQPGVGNPYAAGFNHQNGTSAMHEPLYFFSAFANKTIPWLAEGPEQYNDDFTEVTIKIRPGVEWSDGQPFTARDVAFTLNMLRQNEKLPYGGDMKKWVKNAEAVDDATVKVAFNQPAPRFVFDFLTNKFDLGIFYVPEHIFKDQQDVASFLFYDPAKGWPLVTGPYQIVDWSPQQMLMDLRPDWWAAKTGFAALPKVERIVSVPFPDDTGAAQAIINNEIDTSLDLRPQLIKTVIESNEKIITHTGREAPYGYTDWWPNSLWFNCEVTPYNDPEVRNAVKHAIDRDQIIAIAYEGAGVPTELPFPAFPSLQKYFDAAKPLLEKYPTKAFDPSKTEQVMSAKGYTKDGEGLWVGPDGARINARIYGFSIFADYGPVLAEQLRNAGFEASFEQPPDAYQKMADGSAHTFLFGHGGAIADVYPTLDLFHSRHAAPTGTDAGTITARWKNEEYDKIVDQLAQLPVDDPKGMPLYLQALEIYLREMPEVPIIQWLHRIPYNTTYWTNWPTAENPYINGAFWHKTFPLILHQLQPVQR
jgi:peptide/nickel transport system substrate-binding protein